MDVVSSLWQSNSSLSAPPIDSGRWLTSMDSFYTSFLLFSCLFTAIVFALALLHLYFVLRFVSNPSIQTDLYHLIFMFPVTALCGLIGMFIPRAAVFLYSVALVYQMLCLFVTISLLFNIFGGRRMLAAHLQALDTPIDFKVPPVCCLSFLPQIEATERNVRRVEWMVFQSPLIRLLLETANIVVFLELNHRHHVWFLFSQLVGLLSMCVAFYGCYVLVPAASEEIYKYRFGVIFRSVDMAQCLYTIQKFGFDVAASTNIIKGDSLLGPSQKAQFWTSFMLTWEMVFMSTVVTYLLRPSKTVLFDKLYDQHPDSIAITYSNGNDMHRDERIPRREPSSTIKGFARHFDSRGDQ